MRQTQNTKKDNRKSIFVIALLLLLVAVIGFGGYTMSKYISSKSQEGSASVAKWGYTISADTTKLFGDEYVAGVIGDSSAEGAVITAKADTTNRLIVAPGHSGSMTFTVKGVAEVKAQVKLSLTDYQDVVLGYTTGGTATSYNPIVWTLAYGSTTVSGSLEEIAGKLNDAVATYDAAATVNETFTLSWTWAFESGHDELDTLLGMYANATTNDEKANITNGAYKATTDTKTDVKFTLNISVEQVMD